jgi:hypothetical protein
MGCDVSNRTVHHGETVEESSVQSLGVLFSTKILFWAFTHHDPMPVTWDSGYVISGLEFSFS